MYLFLPLAHAFQHVCRKVIVLHLFKAQFDDLPQVVGLGSPGVGGKIVKPLLYFRSESN